MFAQATRQFLPWSVIAFVFTMGCQDHKTKPKPAPKTAPKTAPKKQTPKPISAHAALEAQASQVVLSIAKLESSKDVTCWTSFRQLDSFIATRQYSELATLTKVSASTSLIRHLWQQASLKAKGAQITLAEFNGSVENSALKRVASLSRDDLGPFAKKLGMKEFKDYRKTSEHWRIVLSVLFDEISKPKTTLKPLDHDALDALAEVSSKIALLLSRDAGALATEARSPLIEPNHVLSAYESLAKQMGMRQPALYRVTGRQNEQIKAHLHKLTGQMIRGKVGALLSYNKQPDLLKALNSVSRVPMNQDAVKIMIAQTQSFARFVAMGFEPMRQDNFLADGSFASGQLKKKNYLDTYWTQHVVMQLFPHILKPNGDILLHFEPNPALAQKSDAKAKQMTLLDYEQNGVRDSAMHWLVLNNVFKKQAFAMDPFAAEYLSEVISMLMTYFIRRGQMLAKAQGKSIIDGEIAKQVRDRAFVQVLPGATEAKKWPEAKLAIKARVLKTLPNVLFVDGTAKANLPTNIKPPTGDLSSLGLKKDIQRVMGSGVAVGDVNGDGLVDMFVAGESMGRLYINGHQKQPGRFEDATQRYGIDSPMHDSRGALFFDMEGDGDLDLLVVRSGHPSKLYESKDGKFIDVAKQKGFVTHNGAHVAHIFDADGDGDLDIYIGYYGNHQVNTGQSQARNLPTIDGRNSSPNQLWLRQPDGSYVEGAKRAGLADTGWTLAVSSLDLNGDQLPDLYLANDFGANRVFLNEGKGRFKDISVQSKMDDRGSGMNVSVLDVNSDGLFDLYLTNIDMFTKSIKVVFPNDASVIPIKQDMLQSFQYITGNKLYVSDKKSDKMPIMNAEEQARFEPGDRGWAWDGNFFDMDNDGDDDMYLANGWIPNSYAANQANQLFVQDNGLFFMAPVEDASAFKANSRAVASVDVDNDGDLDLIVTNFWGAPTVLLNQHRGNNWLKVCLEQKGPNRLAFGSRIEARVAKKRMLRQTVGGRGYLSQDDPSCVHFGLGKAAKATVRITWPGGATAKTTSHDLKANTRHTITRP